MEDRRGHMQDARRNLEREMPRGMKEGEKERKQDFKNYCGELYIVLIVFLKNDKEKKKGGRERGRNVKLF